MKRLVLLLLLLVPSLAFGAFTEFYVQTTGSNLNAGSTNTNAAAFTYASGTWVASTGVFTVASGNPTSDGVAVGDFASVYPDGSTVGVFVGRVTARSSTTITVSLTAKSGTAPTDGTNTRTLKIGGAWKGPNAAEGFPFNFVASTMTDASSNVPCVNFKTGTNYAITAAMSHGVAGTVRFQGYTTAVRDGGKAVIDGGTTGVSYTLLAITTAANFFEDFIFQNNGASAQAIGVQASGSGGGNIFVGCVFAHMRGNGVQLSTNTNGTDNLLVECEAYDCNQANAVAICGMALAGNSVAIRCVAHDNTGSNNVGFRLTVGASLINCISESNGQHGAELTAGAGTGVFIGCDFYNNGADGIRISASAATAAMIQNCNFIKNAAWGINRSGAGLPNGNLRNCGFGAGTQANASGTTTGLGSMVETNSVTYAGNVTPWVDPANGDFRINLAAAKNAGRGAFTQTAASYAGTIGYPDIGAAQHLETACPSPSPSETSHTFAQ